MKRIFFIFLTLLWAGIAGSTENLQVSQANVLPVPEQTAQQDSSALINLARRFAADVYLPMRAWAQQVQKNNPQQVDIKNTDPLTALYLATTTDVNFLTGTRGYTEWQSYPFGRMRLVSCRAGLKKDTPVFVGVQVRIDSDWALYKPDIVLNTPSRETVISYPLSFKLPKGITRTFLYDKEVIFPIFFMPDSFDKPVEVSVRVDWRALNPYTKQDISDTAEFIMPLTLEEPYETGICPYMTSFLGISPAPAKDKVKISANMNKHQEIQLFFEFKYPTETLSIQVDDVWTFSEQQKTVNGKTATLIINPSQTLKAGDVMPLKVITSFGVFDVPTVIKEGNFHHERPEFNLGGVVADGLWLFFLTPLFSYFLLCTKRSAAQLKKETAQTLIFLCVVGFAWTLAWQSGLFLPVDVVQYSFVALWLTVLWLLWWMIRPNLSLGLMGLMVIFLPKPYLADTIGLSAYYPMTPLIAGGIWTVMVMWPFWWIYRYPEAFITLHHLMRADKRAFWWIVRMPAVVILIWLGIGGGIVSFTNTYKPYMSQALKQAVSSGQTVFVSIRPTVCLTCSLMQTSIGMSREVRDLKKEHKLVQMILPANLFEAKDLMKRYGKVSAPMHLLYGAKQPSGILLPDYTDYAGLNKYLNMVK